jgi:hypothetical protein
MIGQIIELGDIRTPDKHSIGDWHNSAPRISEIVDKF